MSLSAKSRAFVPSPTASLWSEAAYGQSSGTRFNNSEPSRRRQAPVPPSATQPQSHSRMKERVCMAFYECGTCPYGGACAHAHHFADLSPDAQTTLLVTVPVESIPSHFMNPPTHSSRSTRDGVAGFKVTQVDGGATSTPASFTPYGRFNGGTGSRGLKADSCRYARPGALRGAGGAGGASREGAAALETASASSQASSSPAGSPRPASPKSASHSAMALDAFRVHLPDRCRYPHSGINGTYYSFLGVSRHASQDEIIGKYRLWQREAFKHMRVVDPVGAESADRIIVEARNVLGNPILRGEYDRTLPAETGATRSTATGNGAFTQWSSPTPTATKRATAWSASSAHVNVVSSSAGTSRAHDGHSSSSSASSAASGAGSGRLPSSGAGSLPGEKPSSVATLTTNMFSDDIW